jgi:hypothetical protein
VSAPRFKVILRVSSYSITVHQCKIIVLEKNLNGLARLVYFNNHSSLEAKVTLLLSRYSHINLRELERLMKCLGVNYERQKASSASHIGNAVISRYTSEGSRTKSDSLSSLRQNLQDQLGDGETQRYNAPWNKRTRVITIGQRCRRDTWKSLGVKAR